MGGDLSAELAAFRDDVRASRSPDALMARLAKILVAAGQVEAAARVAGWLRDGGVWGTADDPAEGW